MGKKNATRKSVRKVGDQHHQTDLLQFLVQPPPSPSTPPTPPSEPDTFNMSDSQPSPAASSSATLSKGDMGEILKRLDILSNLPTKQDLLDLEARLQDKLDSQITAMQSDISQVNKRVDVVESNQEDQNSQALQMRDIIEQQASAIRDIQHRLDDLDNRGRRNNLRVRGLPEEIPQSGLVDALTKIFNEVLEADPNNTIEFDRAHRALRPRGPPNGNPRDVICRLHYYKIKEEILQKARRRDDIDINGSSVQIYQDLSWYTLQQRRYLKPLTDLLRSKGIRFRWGFPISIQVSHEGKSAHLRSPEDIQNFCETLALTPPPLPEWRRSFTAYSPMEIPRQTEWQLSQGTKRKSAKNQETPSLRPS